MSKASFQSYPRQHTDGVAILPHSGDLNHDLKGLVGGLVTPESSVTTRTFDATTRSATHPTQQPTKLARAIQRLHSECGSWPILAAALGVNQGLLWKVAHGKIARSPKVAAAISPKAGCEIHSAQGIAVDSEG